jgi:leader peptidase (prepilin peptidase)/N-methyltransferase
MNVELAALAFAPGLAIGSFLNVVAARIPLHRSIVSPGSACMSCETPLAWYDNIPLVSYAILRGRCRHCKAAIPWRYPAVEAATALLIAGCALKFGWSWDFLIGSAFCAVLVVISATDLERRVIPNRIVVPASVVLLAAQTIVHPSAEWAIAAVAASLFFFLAALAYPGGMGMGDVKLAFLLGAVLGRTVAVALLGGMIFALVPSVFLLVRHGSKARKMAIPFGPFLALGGVVALFFGTPILNGYLGVL